MTSHDEEGPIDSGRFARYSHRIVFRYGWFSVEHVTPRTTGKLALNRRIVGDGDAPPRSGDSVGTPLGPTI